MVDAKKIEELRGLLAADTSTDWQTVRAAAALIRSLSLRVETEKRAKEEAETENARLARLVYVPGQWRCAKCKFTLIQANLNANGGTVTARDQPGDKCPNCDSPLWRVTERDAGNEMIDRAEEAFEAKRAAETHSAALARALEEARDELLECKADYHRNPSSVIDKCNAVLAEARSPLASRRTQIHNKKL